MSDTFSHFSVDFEVVWGEDVVEPPRESSLLLLDPPLVVEHVLGGEGHWVSGYSWRKGADRDGEILY